MSKHQIFILTWKILIAAGSIAFSACMDIRAVGPSKHSEEAAAAVDTEGPSVQALPELHKYQVVFGAIGITDSFVVQRQLLSIPGEANLRAIQPLSRQLALTSGSAVDGQVEDGTEYMYRWGSKDAYGNPEREAKVWIPKDIVVEGEMDEKNSAVAPLFNPYFTQRGIGRMHFKEHSILTTHGRDLSINVGRLYSENGILRTFNPGNHAADPGLEGSAFAGISGGKIILRAMKASGILKVEMRGQDGGSGPQGRPPLPTMKGETGVKGVNAIIEFTGAAAYGLIQSGRCKTLPTAGGQGGKGKTGFPGETGGHGGDSGELEVHVPADLKVEWIREAGRGGIGGRGGDGGAGGDGGPGGDPVQANLFFPNCQPAPYGQVGERGTDGPNGGKGQDGRVQVVCTEQDGGVTCTP